MRYINRLCGFLIAASAVFTLAACAPLGSTHGFAYDTFWVVPRRMTYSPNGDFQRQSDLSAFASFQGAVDSISIDQVEIRITENPDSDSVEWSFPISDSYKFGGDGGKKLVRVSYGGLVAEYAVMVLDTSGNGGTGNEGNDGVHVNGGGIIMVWPK